MKRHLTREEWKALNLFYLMRAYVLDGLNTIAEVVMIAVVMLLIFG